MSDVSCNQCGQALSEAKGLALSARSPCPTCGSLSRAYQQTALATVVVRASLALKQKRPGRRGYLVTLFDGWELRRSVGDLVKKYRLIDRAQNRYVEHVETADGEVLKAQDHPLTDHTGHGSAKRATPETSDDGRLQFRK